MRTETHPGMSLKYGGWDAGGGGGGTEKRKGKGVTVTREKEKEADAWKKDLHA